MFIELTLTELQVLPEAPDSLFEIPEDSYRVMPTSNRPTVGSQGPDWTLPLPGGGTISSTSLRGNVALLFFWASWCPTCHGYFPEIQRIHETYPASVRVLAINAFDRDDAMAYIREHGYSFDVALDGDDLLANQLGFIGQPALLLLDRDGVIRYRKLGPGDSELLPLIEALINEP
jgi:thiol-disulfide isomerase/thioredoxin